MRFVVTMRWGKRDPTAPIGGHTGTSSRPGPGAAAAAAAAAAVDLTVGGDDDGDDDAAAAAVDLT